MTSTIEQAINEAVQAAVKQALAAPMEPASPYPEGKTTLTVKEAAAILGVCLAKMYDITERADFDALLRMGRKKVILTHKFYAWLERQAQAGGDVLL